METINQLPQHHDARYAQLFMQHPELHQQLGLERSYGFLLAASSAPSLVMPDEWLHAVWLSQPEQGINAEQREALVALYNHWHWQNKQPELTLPAWQSNPQSLSAFCQGYLAGHDWLHNLWQEALTRFAEPQDERILSSTLLLCMRLCADESTATPLDSKLSREDALHLLPARLHTTARLGHRLFDAFQQQSQQARNPQRNTGRNDPCPCGSGNKFKKCCASQARHSRS